MNKNELISAVAEKSQLTKKDSEAAVNAIFAVITEALSQGDRVQYTGFGTFDVKKRPERIARNPRTGEQVTVPEAKVPVFKPGKLLRDAVEGK